MSMEGTEKALEDAGQFKGAEIKFGKKLAAISMCAFRQKLRTSTARARSHSIVWRAMYLCVRNR